MVQVLLQAVDQPDVAAKAISSRLRSQIAYFSHSEPGHQPPTLGENEYFFPAKEVARILDDGCVQLVSPLDTANMTEVELSDEQEDLLNWLLDNKIQHIRVLE
jgi:hypothetical protein